MSTKMSAKEDKQPNETDDDYARRVGVEVLRQNLALKLQQFAADWRLCPRGVCRRHRACHAAQNVCRGLPPPRPISEQQWGREKAWLLRALKRRGAELAAADAAAPASAAAAPRRRPAPACRDKAPGTSPSGSPPSARR